MKAAAITGLFVAGGAAVAGCVEPPGPEEVQVGVCDGVITTVPIEDGEHLPVGSPITWSTNPPATGAHYPVWAEWEKRYDALERAYWLHNAEHGGIVLLHRCTDCPDVVASLVDVIATLPDDPHCTAPLRTRTLVVADPLLPPEAPIAAVAWGATYTASCVDQTLATFAADNYGRTGENICADGLPLGGVALE